MPKLLTVLALVGVMVTVVSAGSFVNHRNSLDQEKPVVLVQLEPNWKELDA